MSDIMTTTGNIRVEDVTFRKARNQSAVLKELAERRGRNNPSEANVSTPVSLTPESVKSFFKSKIEATSDIAEKRVYMQTVRWIDDMLAFRKELTALKLKEVVSDSDDDFSVED